MSESSLSTGIGSTRSHSHRTLTPDAAPAASDPGLDTALPPINARNSSTSPRRLQHRSQTSVIVRNPRGPTRPPFYNAQDSMSSMVARSPQMHRRNGSTLKTVMRRIFSRKRRSQTNEFEDTAEESPFGESFPRRSNAGSETNSFLAISNSLNSKGNSPFQKETGHCDITEDALQRLSPMPPRRRRATLPSLILSDDALESALGSGKPEHSRVGSADTNNPEDDMRRRYLRTKRCSRSATSLRRMATEHQMSPIQWRRRSTEMNFWGPSAPFRPVSDSELSVRPTTGMTVASMARESDRKSVAPSVAASVAPSVAPSEATSVAPSALESPTQQKMEVESIPPNVGQLINSMQADDNLSLEQRLATLEVKLIDLEFAIARMQDQRVESPPADKPKRKKASTPDVSQQHARKKSSSYFPPTGGDTSRSTPSTSAEERPLSTGTIRPTKTLHRPQTMQTPSTTSLSDLNGISVDQYSALVMLLRREQSARRNLESQVTSLQEDMQYFFKMATDSMKMGSRYPIPSADSHDLLRFRRAMDRPQSDTPIRMDDKIGSPYDSDSDLESAETKAKGDIFARPKWDRNRIEITGMI